MLTLASALAASTSKSSSGGGFLFILLGAVVLMFLLSSRNRRAQARRNADMQTNIVPGTEVMTTAGMHATVIENEGDTVRLEIAPGVVSRFDKRAIARVITPTVPTVEEPASPFDDHDDSTESAARE